MERGIGICAALCTSPPCTHTGLQKSFHRQSSIFLLSGEPAKTVFITKHLGLRSAVSYADKVALFTLDIPRAKSCSLDSSESSQGDYSGEGSEQNLPQSFLENKFLK